MLTHWWSTILVVLMVTLFQGDVTKAVRIRELRVPEVVELKSASNEENVNDDILLDCDFEYEEAEAKQLDIKWYFNGEPTFFYQWVAGQTSKPQLIDSERSSSGRLFRHHVDLDHVIDGSDDPYKRHRALLLKKPTVALSGVYECKVSTFLDEDIQRKKMTIYSPAKKVTFRQDPLPNGDQVNISCAATGIFPQPQIKLLRGSYQLDDSEASVTTSNSGEKEDGDFNTIHTYDIVVHRVVDHAEIPQKTTFGCELTIPGTKYNVKKNSVYQHQGGPYNAAYSSTSSISYRQSTGPFTVIIAIVLLTTSLK